MWPAKPKDLPTPALSSFECSSKNKRVFVTSLCQDTCQTRKTCRRQADVEFYSEENYDPAQDSLCLIRPFFVFFPNQNVPKQCSFLFVKIA